MTTYKIIEKYLIRHVTKWRSYPNMRHMIYCYARDGRRSRRFGTLCFHKDGTALPTNSENTLHFFEGQFESIVTTLRIESPVFFYFSPDDQCGVTTHYEPVGEEEGGSD